ncbi:MAG: EndoU domain-containing protein, partial [Mycobacterium sp.]|nr:EndoU domain-containing protein [Mycobacterium sp.]
MPNPDWVPWFDRFLRLTDGLPYRSLDEMLPAAHEFFDPILSGTDLRAHWDHEQMRWIHEDEPLIRRPVDSNDHPPASAVTFGPERNVLRIEGTGRIRPSTVEIDPQNKAQIWDGLASKGAKPQRLVALFNQGVGREPRITSLNEFLDRLAYHSRSPAESVDQLHEFVTNAGYGVETTPGNGPESGHLRLYSHQSGRLAIHASALMLDPNTTIEIAYQPNRTIEAYAEEAAAAHIRYIGEIPEGITPDQANAVAFDRWAAAKEGRTGVSQEDLAIHDLPEQILMRGILKLQAEPLEAALNMRSRLIGEYGVDPGRIRLAHGEIGCDQSYPSSEQRAHLITLGRFREDTVGSRDQIVNAMLGTGQAAQERAELVDSVAEEVLGIHETPESGPRKYAILWVRESRPFGTHMPELDTRPEQIRQIIEMLKERQPDRTIMLAGDDLFRGRKELLDLWRRDGVLTGVDRQTLVGFWESQNLTRAEQALVFHRIGTQRDVVQIGMENGVLGPQALLGIPTVYLSAQEPWESRGDLLEYLFRPWQFGHTVAVLDKSGNRVYNHLTGLPRTEFRPVGPELEAPFPTIGQVHFQPDLSDTVRPPADLYGDRQAKVNRVSSQIAAQMDSGEMDSWRYRLGLLWPDPTDPEPVPWSARDWETSRWYAHQLSRWLHTDATTPEQVAGKWDGIRLALKGVLSPRFTIDETYRGASVVHPYLGHFSEQPVPDGITRLIAEAYGAGPDSGSEFDPRPGAVTDALKQLLAVTDIKTQAVRDLAAFGMRGRELDELHATLDRVISRNDLHQASQDEKGYHAPPGGTAWDAVGAATHSGRPVADSLWVPEPIATHILEGDELGGGHRFGRGLPGKSEFPQRWTDSDVVRHVLEVAAEPDWVHFQSNGRWKVRGERDGVEMSVIIDPRGQVWSAWPRSG